MYKADLLYELVAKNFITLDDTAKPISEIEAKLSEKISYNEILETKGKYFDLPTADIFALKIDEDVINMFSPALIAKNKFLPVSISDGTLTVAICNPTDFIALSAIKAAHNGPIEFLLVDEPSLIKRIQSLAAVDNTTNVLRNLNASLSEPKPIDEIQNAPAVKLVDSVFHEAISYRASDIHIEPYDKTVRVRYRIDGSLYERAEFALDSYSAVCARLKILAGINIAEHRVPQDGRINMTVGDSEYNFRVSTLPTVYGEKFAIRILDKSAFGFSRDELGFTDKENDLANKILSHPYGIVLLTGPTGCGKSTTLYSFLKELNKPDVNIVTVEDPVEYTLPGINQTQVNTKANMTFANALRSILRQDPNVIMIGEIRDEETAQIAIRAAITGHLVLSTLHTNDAPGSIVRLIDMGIPPYLVADAVVGVIAQRLVKKLCPHCKTKSLSSKSETQLLKLNNPIELYRPKGCPYCNDTGYKGRTAVFEIMYLDDELRYAINENTYVDTLRSLAVKKGMTPLLNACRKLVIDGTTSIDEMIKLISE